MVSDIWRLTVDGGAPVTMSSLGMYNVRIVRPTLSVGQLTFDVKVDNALTTQPFTYGQKLIVYRNAVLWWVGKVRRVSASFSGGQATWNVRAADGWWEMERTVYRQPIAAWNDTFTDLIGWLSTRVTLNQDAWGVQITQGEQIVNAQRYAANQNPDTLVIGTATPMDLEWSKEETREITAAECIRRAASLAPTAFPERLYSTDGTQVNFKERSDLTLATLDLNDANLISQVQGLAKRDDIIPPGVVFDFFTNTVDGDGNKLIAIERQFAGTPGAAGTIYASFILGPCDTAPADSASDYYAALTDAQWEGTIMLKEQDCSGLVGPGYRVCLANGLAAWATMDAVVQEVAEYLDSGETTIEMGPSDVLGLDDFLGQLTRLRNRPAPTGFCSTQTNSTEGTATGVDDEGNPTTPPTGADQGITGGATGNKPATSPVPNPNAGSNAFAALITYGLTDVVLTLCDSTTVTLLKR